MELEFRRREKIVGFFIVAVFLLLLFTVVVIGRGKDWFKTYVPYYTEFAESYNLAENAPVKMAKTKIGKVKNITLTQDKVRVDIGIMEEYAPKIRKGSVATVESPTIIGEEYLSITPGPARAPEIPPGEEIVSKPKKSVQEILAEIAVKFQLEETGKKVVGAVTEATEMVHVLRDPNGPLFTALDKINSSLSRLDAILAGVQRGEGSLGGFVRSDKLLQELYANLDQLRKVLENITTATAKAPGTMDEVQANLAAVRRVVESVHAAVATTQKILDNVSNASQEIPKVTESTKRGIGELRDNLKNIDKVVESIKQNPLIRGNLPKEPQGGEADARLRP